MTNSRPGYWDVDACAWVGAEPTYVLPPARPGEHAGERVVGDADVPSPRDDAESAPLASLEAEPPVG